MSVHVASNCLEQNWTDACAVETGQTSAVETGQMSDAEAGQLSLRLRQDGDACCAETGRISKLKTFTAKDFHN